MSDTTDYKLLCQKQEALIMLMGAALIEAESALDESRNYPLTYAAVLDALHAYNCWLDAGPGEEDGPWAAGYEDRAAGSIKEEPFTARRAFYNLQYGRDLTPPEHLLGLYINWDVEATYWHEWALSMHSSIYRPTVAYWIY